MLQLSVREFNKNISKAMKTLPVEITNRGVPFATIVSTVPQGKGFKRKEDIEIGMEIEMGLKTPAKFVKINKEDLKGGIKVDMKKAREGVVGAINPELGRVPEVSKNAGESSSVTPSHSASPPPSVEIKLRKKICPTHSIFSCGCPEKEGKGEQR